MALAAAPSLVNGSEVPAKDGGPMFFRDEPCWMGRADVGIAAESWRWGWLRLDEVDVGCALLKLVKLS